MRRAAALAAVSFLCAACGGVRPSTASGPGMPPDALEAFRYVVRFDPSLETLDVTVCFRGEAPERLYAGEASAAARLLRAEVRTAGAAVQELAREGRSIWLPRLPRGGCVGYVSEIDGRGRRWWGRPLGDARLLKAASWLWRPSPRRDGAVGTIRFEPPDAMSVAVPWPAAEREGEYLLDERAFGFLTHTAFGRLERQVVAVPGGELDVVRLPGRLTIDAPSIARWLETVGTAVADIHGRFPAPRAMVLLVPAAGGDRPIMHGNVGRGGGASVMLVVNSDATLEDLLDEWVTPHELSHLAMPFVRREDAWLSEGVATYYQEVLRARAGTREPVDAWRGLDSGFESGRNGGTGRPLREESRTMFQTRSFRRVYWSGTALALLYDVSLRRRGGEVGSLDVALTRLGRCCGQRNEAWSAAGVVRQLDRITGEPVFSGLARTHLPSREFPDVESLYGWLGLARGPDGRLVLVDGAPGARVRDAIMSASRAE